MKPEPFIPEPLPPSGIDWITHIPLIGAANAALARFDGLLQSIQNPDLLLAPLITQEAVISSRIEGTQATMRELFLFEAKTLNPDSILIVETAENLPPLMVMQKRSEINQIRERKIREVNQAIQEQH